MEKLIVSLIVVAAIAILIWRITRSVKTSGCCSGGCSCHKEDGRKKSC